MQFRKLLEPFQIKKVNLRNRMVKAPQDTLLCEDNGFVNDKIKDYYEALAMGGVGLIIVESTQSDYPMAQTGGTTKHLHIYDDKFIPGLSNLSGIIHKYGCPVFLQLGHGGPLHAAEKTGLQPVSASELSNDECKIVGCKYPPRQLSINEIEAIIDKFARGAERAKKAGFDGIEIHGAHRYLVNSFLSRAWNHRNDSYGENDIENRAKFPAGIIKSIKQLVGDDFIVGIRFNGSEPGLVRGITIEESKKFGKIFEEAGADYLHISTYGYGPFESLILPEQIFYPELSHEARPLARIIKKLGALVPWAEEIKKEVSIPVIVVGGLDPKKGERILQNEMADLVAFGRALLADPEMPNKVAEGKLHEIAPCTACRTCEDCYFAHQQVRCRINAAIGRESIYRLKQTESSKKVVVIGGGPSGMEAARVAAIRGHKVTLYEKNKSLGGLLLPAAMIKGTKVENLPVLIRYFKKQLKNTGVTVRCGKEVGKKLIESINPDVVLLATGGIPHMPEIPGIKRRNVVSSGLLLSRVTRFLQFISPKYLRWLTKFWMPIGKRVAVIGGLIHGCEIGEFLLKRGRKVTILEESDQLGTGIPNLNRERLLRWMHKRGAVLLTQVKYKEITEDGLIIENKDGQNQLIKADTLLISMPLKQNLKLYNNLKGTVPELKKIGDCTEPRMILDAIADGAAAGRAI